MLVEFLVIKTFNKAFFSPHLLFFLCVPMPVVVCFYLFGIFELKASTFCPHLL